MECIVILISEIGKNKVSNKRHNLIPEKVYVLKYVLFL